MAQFKFYKITDLSNGKVYVGRTQRTPQERFQEHCHADSLLGRAIRDHGKEQFKIEIIAETDSFDEANGLERHFIAELNCKNPNGYNLTDGGDGRAGCPHTAEECAKISAANKGQIPWIKGKKHSEETKQKIAAALIGHEVPQTVRDKISETLTGRPGRPHTEEEKAKISARLKASWAKRKAQQTQ